MSNNQTLNFWVLAHLEQELEIIASKLDSIAAQNDLAEADPGLYLGLLRQVNKCHSHLQSASRSVRT